MRWLYKDKPVSDKSPSDKSFGFVYLIEYEDGTMYVGKKNFYSITTMKPLVTGKQRPNGIFFNKIVNHKVTQFERVKKESAWRKYDGSSKKTKHLKVKSKTILKIYGDKLNLTFGEIEYMIKLDVLRNEMYHNDNILGKFYKEKIK